MKLEKILKKLTETVVEELDGMDVSQLHKMISDCEVNIAKAQLERDNNPKYQSAKEIAGDFNGALNEAKGYQRAKIAYVLIKLSDKEGN